MRSLADFALPALRAVDERLVVAGELEPKLRAVAGEVDAALQAPHGHGLDHAGKSDPAARKPLLAAKAMSVLEG